LGLLTNHNLAHVAGSFGAGSFSFNNTAMKHGSRKFNRFYGDGFLPKSATPNGYLHPYSLMMPRIAGGIASYKLLIAELETTSASLVSGRGLDASLSAALTLTPPQLQLISDLIANLSAALSLTDAELSASASLVADINASLTITNAQLGAIVGMIANLLGSLTLTNANYFATASMSADMSLENEFSPTKLAEAVWGALAATYNAAGTMGEKVNAAGSAGNPWTETIEGTLSANEVLRILLAVAAGKTTITPGSGDTATVTFRDVANSKDRLTVGMVGSERDTVTRDGT
jgi:hypothetical protein